jgi:hypothetical protein
VDVVNPEMRLLLAGQQFVNCTNFQEETQMKKFAICAALVLAVMLIPSAQAATKCYHLTNFCDGLQVTNIHVGGIQANEYVGLWDWLCLGNNTGTLISGGAGPKIGTQPLYPYSGGAGYGFNANFTFKNLTKLFDLYATFDGSTTFAFQTNQPYTTTVGPCNPLGPRQPGMKSAVGLR